MNLDRQRWLRASPYLDRMLDLTPPERPAWMVMLRADNPGVAADVEALLQEHLALSTEGFLAAGAVADANPPALAGVRVGAYTLVSPIGQGGMGSVWLASRSDGRFDGQAAVKLLNSALIGRAAEERFKREGTILARLAHPNIARLIDAGVSSTGQPYLVLEHVDGQHIVQYCDSHRLDVESRVRLFLDVLSAVAQAHANLVVHRDLKPSNVLVTKDGQVKLLDFGIAKLLEGENPQEAPTLLTNEGGAGMTPKYAAPEQVKGSDVTTATDVYALGVLLYELLSGHHPAGDGLPSLPELVRAIVDTEPARPSATAQLPDPPGAAEVAARRGTTPDRLRRALKGDLDTIVAKALKKRPEDRYCSVVELADDLRRYLAHQPIAARPDAMGYRAAKFARRHRSFLAAAAGSVLVVGSLIAFYTVQLAGERDRARLEAEKASKISELMSGLLTGADPYRTPDAKELTVRGLLDAGAERIATELKDRPDLKAEMLTVIGRTYQRMGLSAKAKPLLEEALTLFNTTIRHDDARLAQVLNDMGVLQRQLGNVVEAQARLEESLAMRRRLFGSIHKDVAVTLVELARALKDRGLHDASEPLIREALATRREVFGEEHRETATSKNELALLLWDRGQLDEAETLFRENIATTLNVLGPEHSNVASAKQNLALVISAKGDKVSAERLFREALAIHNKNVGPRHPDYANTLSNLSAAVRDQGRLGESLAMIEESVGVARTVLGENHNRTVTYMLNLGKVHLLRGEPARAEPVLRHVVEVRQRLYPAGDWKTAQAKGVLGGALVALARYAEAEPLLLDAAAVLKPIPGPQGKEAAAVSRSLAAMYAAWGRPPRTPGQRAEAAPHD